MNYICRCLIQNKGYKVICITNQDNPKRLKEFTGVMKELIMDLIY